MSNRTILLCTFLSLLTLGCEQFRRPQKSGATEIVGQVVDSDTLEPIEGAYVMATYDLQHVPYDYACARSLGVFSDKDGNYRFPIEKSDLYPSGYPHQVFAAKSGYFYSAFATDRSVDSSAASWVIDTRTRVYLAKQDYLNPKRGFNTYHANCYQSRNRKDAVASVEFQKIELEELRKLGTRAAILDSTVERIRALQLLPSIGGEYPNPTRRVYGPDYRQPLIL